MKKIEARENEFIKQFKELLQTSFPPAFEYNVEFIIGEDDQGRRGLYFELSSKRFGALYKRFEEIEPHMVASDIEDEFISKVINDFVLAGVTLMNIEALDKRKFEKAMDHVHDKHFKNSLPKRLLFLN